MTAGHPSWLGGALSRVRSIGIARRRLCRSAQRRRRLLALTRRGSESRSARKLFPYQTRVFRFYRSAEIDRGAWTRADLPLEEGRRRQARSA